MPSEQQQTWWRRGLAHLPKPSAHPAASSGATPMCPCAACYEVSFQRRSGTASSSSSSLSIVPGARPASLQRSPTSSDDEKKDQAKSRPFKAFLRRRASFDTLASDFIPLRAEEQANPETGATDGRASTERPVDPFDDDARF